MIPPVLAVFTFVCLASFSIWEVIKKRRVRSVFVSKYPRYENAWLIAAEEDASELPGVKHRHRIADIQLGMKIVVTLALGGAALFMILSGRYGQDSLKWSYSMVGSIAGYWLHT